MNKEIKTKLEIEKMIIKTLKDGGYPSVQVHVYKTVGQANPSASWDIALVNVGVNNDQAVMSALGLIKRDLQDRYDIRP